MFHTKRNIHRILVIVAFISLRLLCNAQIPIEFHTTELIPPDSTDVARMSKRHFWRTAGEVVGFNIGLWAFDRYVQRGDFAYISFNTIKENFKHGFKWDNDKLGTNTFLHPYNGNLYFNAARATDLISGNPSCSLSEAVRCGKCLWKGNTLPQTTSSPPP